MTSPTSEQETMNEETKILTKERDEWVVLCSQQAEEIERLRVTLASERASHCVCKCNDDGEFISQCLTHKEVEDERDALYEALRPFADAARALNNRGRIAIIGPDDLHCDLEMEDLVRAAELIPEENPIASPE